MSVSIESQYSFEIWVICMGIPHENGISKESIQNHIMGKKEEVGFNFWIEEEEEEENLNLNLLMFEN